MTACLGIAGAGAWGIALALAATRAGCRAVLWSRARDHAERLARTRKSERALPGITLDATIEVTADATALGACEAVFLCVPAQEVRASLEGLAAALDGAPPLVICAKGLERPGGRLLSEVAAETWPGVPVAVLSGPTFAAEVARGLPTAVTLACDDAALGTRLCRRIGSAAFRPYLSDDIPGAQIGGAVKNVLAIGCGIAIARGLGENARAALITRGFAETARLGRAKGARLATLAGLSGLGDLVLTCTSEQSRNFSLGLALGRGDSLAAALARQTTVTEGVASAPAVVALARALGVEMPISEAVSRILHERADIDATIGALLARPLRTETGETMDRPPGLD